MNNDDTMWYIFIYEEFQSFEEFKLFPRFKVSKLWKHIIELLQSREVVASSVVRLVTAAVPEKKWDALSPLLHQTPPPLSSYPVYYKIRPKRRVCLFLKDWKCTWSAGKQSAIMPVTMILISAVISFISHYVVVCLGLWMTMRNSTKNTEAVGAIVAKPKSESQVWQIRLQKQTT